MQGPKKIDALTISIRDLSAELPPPPILYGRVDYLEGFVNLKLNGFQIWTFRVPHPEPSCCLEEGLHMSRRARGERRAVA